MDSQQQEELQQLRQQVISYKQMIKIYEKQLQDNKKGQDCLKEWREKCFEYLGKRNIEQYRVHQQDIEIKRLSDNLQQIKKKNFDYLEELDLLRQQNQNQKKDYEQVQNKLKGLLEDKEQEQSFRLRNLQEKYELGLYEFSRKIEGVLSGKLEEQEEKCKTMVKSFERVKKKWQLQIKQWAGGRQEMIKSLKNLILAFGGKVENEIENNQLILVQKVRELMVKLNENQGKYLQKNQNLIKDLENQVEILQKESFQLKEQKDQESGSLILLLEQNKVRIEQMEEQLLEKEEKLEKLKKEIENKQKNFDETSLNNLQQREKLFKEQNEIRNEFQSQIKQIVENYETQISEFKQEINENNQKNQMRELELSQQIEELEFRIQNQENEKQEEIQSLLNQIIIEKEKRQNFHKQCNDLIRLIDMKDKQIKEIKSQQSNNQSLQQQTNISRQNIFQQQTSSQNSQQPQYYQTQQNVNNYLNKNQQHQRNDWSPILKQLGDDPSQQNPTANNNLSRKEYSPKNLTHKSFQQNSNTGIKQIKYSNTIQNNKVNNTVLTDMSNNTQKSILEGEIKNVFTKLEQTEKMAFNILNDE